LNGVEFTCVIAYAAFYAFVLVQRVGLLLFAADSLLRAFARTDATAGTGFSINRIVKQGLADTGRAFFIYYMGLIFIPKIKYGG
jgi:hypothetical protein